MRELTIAGHRIADDSEAFVVAEIGCNHQGSVERCKEIIAAAAAAGADAVKLQKRDMRYWATVHAAVWGNPRDPETSFGRTEGEHRAALEFDWDQYVELKAFAEDLGVVFFATAFDMPSLEFLVRLGVPAIKLASASITNHRLLNAVAATGIPVILSTGGADMNEIRWASEALTSTAPRALLVCTAEYPCPPEDMNLRRIGALRAAFADQVIGLSDHYDGIALTEMGYPLGARIFEKHFTCHRSWKGSDQAWSLEPAGMARLVRDLRRGHVAMGDGVSRLVPGEVAPLKKMGRADLGLQEMSA